MSKIKNIPCDIYKRDIQVFLGSHEEFVKYANKYIKNDGLLDVINNGYQGAADFYYGSLGESIIRLDKLPTTPKEIGIAGHEALHATMHILDYCGVKYTPEEGNEAFTYLHEWILTNILEKKGYKTCLLKKQ